MSEKMRQSFNNVTVEGWVNKKEFEEKSDNTGKEFITGTVEIKTSESNIIPIEMFSYKLTKEGKENKNFKGMQTIANDYKDATQCDNWQDADKVRVTAGELRANEFVGKDKEVHNSIRYVSNFINRVKSSTEFEPKSKFSCEFIFRTEKPEVKNEEETGRGIFDGFYVDFSGNLKPISFIVDKKVWKKAEGVLEKGETVYVSGEIINNAETKVIKTEMEFGEDEERVVTRTVRERLITGMKRVDEEKAYTKEDIKKAFEQRNKFIEELKTKAQFSASVEEEIDVDPDSLPF